ncbi:GCNT1-like protein [Mya arenaria]|uniref:GCNT1-like protein n=1 Tax=Mya arenaria TaxID=6604 RepID=A0ABY7DAH4_MYAAR|nr:GCNT1-like protein [Mya arenaria]
MMQLTSTVNYVRQNFKNNNRFDLRKVQEFLKMMNQQQILAIEARNHLYSSTLIEDPSVVTNKAVLFTNKSVLDFNCQALINGDNNEMSRYIKGFETHKINKTIDVKTSILIHTEVKQVETLLRAIYRPQNLYCIHVDRRSTAAFYEEILAISSCFDNVFLTSQRFDVKWGTMSVLEPEIECMKDLWNKSVSWKYFINLTGQEFPLRTNFELVKILKAYNGANDIAATLRLANKERWSNAGPAPHDIRPSKGPVHIAASKAYVDYLLHDQRAKDLLEWTRKTDVPDETYFSTLNSNPHLNVPGSYNGSYFANPNHTYTSSLTRYKQWRFAGQEDLCKGKFVREICILGVGDLQRLAKSEMLFANKFFLDFQPLALKCLEELIYNRTRDEYLRSIHFNDTLYTQQDFVINQI